MKEVPSSMLTATYGAIPSHTRVSRSPRRRGKRINSFYVCGCFVAVWREGGVFRFIRFVHSYRTIHDRVTFLRAPASRRNMDVFITVVDISYAHQSFLVSVKTRVTSIYVGANFRSLSSSAIVCLGLVVDD